MRTKITLFLVFLNVALFFFIFKFDRSWQTSPELVEKNSRVLGAAAANLQSVKISGPGIVTPVELIKRANEGWFVTKPFEWPANRHAVDEILNKLEQLRHETVFSTDPAVLAKFETTLATYGLAEPRLAVTFSAGEAAGPAQTLWVGAATPDGKRLYVLSPDRKWIHVVDNDLAVLLTKPVDSLRSTRIFSVGATEVRSLYIKPPSTSASRIERDAASNRWQFSNPIRTRASDQATLRAVTSLVNLNVSSFPKNVPTDAFAFILKIKLEGNNRTETLNLGARVARPAGAPEVAGDAEYYGTIETTRNSTPMTSATFTVLLPVPLENLLQKSTEELREPRLFPDLDIRSVTSIDLSGGGRDALSLQRLDAGAQTSWRVVPRGSGAPANPPPADRAVIDRLLARLSELTAVSFVTEAPNNSDLENWGFKQPERVIAFTLSSGQAPAKLELGFDRDRTVLRARFVGGEPSTIYEIRPEIASVASLQPLDYRDRLIRSLDASVARITRIKLTDEIKNTKLLDQSLADPAVPVPPAVAELVRQLQSLRAESFVADTFSTTVPIGDAERPWAYRLEMDIALAAGVGSTQTTMTVLWLSERTGGTVQYAGSEDFHAVWRLEQAMIDPLWKIVSAPTDPGAPGRGN